MGKESSLNMLLKTVLSSWTAIANLCVFISFAMVVFAIIGMHTMGFYCHEQGGTDLGVLPRVNFASFSGAFMACFQVMTGEDWAPIMYYYMHCSSPTGAAMFFITVCSSTGYVLQAMFVAVILENFALADDAKKRIQSDKFKKKSNLMTVESVDVRGASPLAQYCQNIVRNKWFEHLILSVILISSVCMSMESSPQALIPEDEKDVAVALEILGFIFLAIFVV